MIISRREFIKFLACLALWPAAPAFSGLVRAVEAKGRSTFLLRKGLRSDILGYGLYCISGLRPAPPVLIKNKLVSGCKVMIPWSVLEPREGRFDWRHLDERISPWLDEGKRILLKVYTVGMPHKYLKNNFGVDHETPEWVVKKGAKVIRYKPGRSAIRTNGFGAVINMYPVYWDETYLEAYRNFVLELGARYNKKRGIELVYCSTGINGESRPYHEWWKDPVLDRSFDDAGMEGGRAWWSYVRTVLKTYKSAFPATPPAYIISPVHRKVSPWGEIGPTAHYAASEEIVLQNDGGDKLGVMQKSALDILKGEHGTTSLALEAYAPSRDAQKAAGRTLQFVMRGSFKDLANSIATLNVNYALVWAVDLIRATEASPYFDPDWKEVLNKIAGVLRPGPSTHVYSS